MMDMEKIQKLIFIRDYANIDSSQKEVIEKLIENSAFSMYEEICEEYKMCPICGKKLNSNGKISIQDNARNANITVTASVCSDEKCVYNSEVAKKYEEAYRYKITGLTTEEAFRKLPYILQLDTKR